MKHLIAVIAIAIAAGCEFDTSGIDTTSTVNYTIAEYEREFCMNDDCQTLSFVKDNHLLFEFDGCFAQLNGYMTPLDYQDGYTVIEVGLSLDCPGYPEQLYVMLDFFSGFYHIDEGTNLITIDNRNFTYYFTYIPHWDHLELHWDHGCGHVNVDPDVHPLQMGCDYRSWDVNIVVTYPLEVGCNSTELRPMGACFYETGCDSLFMPCVSEPACRLALKDLGTDGSWVPAWHGECRDIN